MGSAVDEVRAKRVVLVEDTGKVRAVLGAATRGCDSYSSLDISPRVALAQDGAIVPPITCLPSVLATGIGSPVIIDSSTYDDPETTMPSTGTRSPGRPDVEKSRSANGSFGFQGMRSHGCVAHW